MCIHAVHMYTAYSPSILHDIIWLVLHGFKKVKKNLVLKPLFHHIPIGFLWRKSLNWILVFNRETKVLILANVQIHLANVQLWFSMMNSLETIRDKNCWVSIHAWKPYNLRKKKGGKIKQKVDQFVFLAKILTCAFPKLVIMIYLWFRKRLGFCSWSFSRQHQMLHLLLLYPHLGCRIGPQRPQVTSKSIWRFTPFLVIPIPSMYGTFTYILVAFYGKCREIYQPHGSYGWCRFTALLSSMYICPSLLVLLVVLVLLSRPQPSGWRIKSGTGYEKNLGLAVDVMMMCNNNITWLVLSTHLKNISQNGNLPQVGVNIKNIWNHHLVTLIQSTWINPDWEVDGAFLQCVQSIVAPYLMTAEPTWELLKVDIQVAEKVNNMWPHCLEEMSEA